MPVSEVTLALSNGRRVPLEIAESRASRRRGLLGRESARGGAMLLQPCRSVHILGMRFAIDVAHLSRTYKVLRIHTMKPNRLGPVVRRASGVLEADAGAFDAWGLAVGDELTVLLPGER